jgi:hypothetical protein
LFTVADAERSAAQLLDEWPSLTCVFVGSVLGQVLRRRETGVPIGVGGNDMSTVAAALRRRSEELQQAADGSLSRRPSVNTIEGQTGMCGDELQLVMPNRILRSTSLKERRQGTTIGAGDAFAAGFVAARCRHLSEAQAFVWAHSASSLVSLFPEAQMQARSLPPPALPHPSHAVRSPPWRRRGRQHGLGTILTSALRLNAAYRISPPS